jgi:hypothetical protein
MDDRDLVQRLLQFGVEAHRHGQGGWADPSNDSQLESIGTAALASWLEELGRHRLIEDVQPQFTRRGGSFRFKVTDEAIRLVSDSGRLVEFLDKITPLRPSYDLFLSYASSDSATASELRGELERKGLTCFMAEKDIAVATEWQDVIRNALLGSKRILILITPRSMNRPWIFLETGAAWALGKTLIPALVQVSPSDLLDPIRRYQARIIETTAQRRSLVRELA